MSDQPYWQRDGLTLHCGDCIDVMRDMPDESVSAIVTDPPYGLGFMGKAWDSAVPPVDVWREALRVLKPGGHMLVFADTRTQHLMASAIEAAGFEIRDMIAWVYGSGFPKSLDVGKAIDKAAGAERERYERPAFGGTFSDDDGTTYGTAISNAPATPDAAEWCGWGTALKPALEPVTVARKPLTGTVAANVLEHGTGALNIDWCRVAADDGADRGRPPRTPNSILGNGKGTNLSASEHNDIGRWPANLIHDGSDEVVKCFPDEAGGSGKASGPTRGKFGTQGRYGTCTGENMGESAFYGDSGSAARFFYVAKPDTSERNRNGADNTHPTVKPIALMRYLIRLVTPPGGVVLDPFAGSGTTLCAAQDEHMACIGIEIDEAHCAIAKKRCGTQRSLFVTEAAS